jgi:YjbE family integral membrane protein
MDVLLTPDFWARWLSIVIIDLTLAGDNALVIAMAVRNLPARQQLYGRLGGTFGAVALRLGFIAIITQLLRIPLLQAFGALLLIWIAVRLVRQEDPDAHGSVRTGTTLREAIWIIIMADVVMSLDNVLAVAGAAHGDFLLVALGIGMSIPIVIWGSGILARLMGRFPQIVWLGAGVLGWVAGEMFLKDETIHTLLAPVADALHYSLPAVLALGLIILAWRLNQRALQRSLAHAAVIAPSPLDEASAK